MRVLIQRRVDTPRWLSLIAPLASVLLAFLVGAIIMVTSGKDPIMVYGTMLKSALTTRFGITETVVKAIPLMLCGFAVAVTLRMKVVNLGAEGQIYISALAVSGFAVSVPNLPAWVMLPAMFIIGCIAGALWSALAVFPKVLWGTSEVITTLMLNYVAMLWVSYLVNGPWKDPTARGFPLGVVFSPAAQLPTLGTTRVHMGLLIALVLAVALTFLLRRTRFGYEMQVVGASQRAARYAGMNIPRTIMLVTLLSGALAGLAGMTEVSGVIHRLQEGISPGYGFSGIIVAALARYSPLGVVVVSFLFGALLVGGYGIQTVGISANIVQILQGSVLIFVISSEFILQYRVRLMGTPSTGSNRLRRLFGKTGIEAVEAPTVQAKGQT